jgi:hypothetical protein
LSISMIINKLSPKAATAAGSFILFLHPLCS